MEGIDALIAGLILAGLSVACSMLDAALSDAGPESPLWKRILSQVISKGGFNFGAAKNDPKVQ